MHIIYWTGRKDSFSDFFSHCIKTGVTLDLKPQHTAVSQGQDQDCYRVRQTVSSSVSSPPFGHTVRLKDVEDLCSRFSTDLQT